MPSSHIGREVSKRAGAEEVRNQAPISRASCPFFEFFGRSSQYWLTQAGSNERRRGPKAPPLPAMFADTSSHRTPIDRFKIDGFMPGSGIRSAPLSLITEKTYFKPAHKPEI